MKELPITSPHNSSFRMESALPPPCSGNTLVHRMRISCSMAFELGRALSQLTASTRSVDSLLDTESDV